MMIHAHLKAIHMKGVSFLLVLLVCRSKVFFKQIILAVKYQQKLVYTSKKKLVVYSTLSFVFTVTGGCFQPILPLKYGSEIYSVPYFSGHSFPSQTIWFSPVNPIHCIQQHFRMVGGGVPFTF